MLGKITQRNKIGTFYALALVFGTDVSKLTSV